MRQEYVEAIEEQGWKIWELEDGSVDLEKYSPAGEDFIISLTSTDNLAEALQDYYEDFDPEEHAGMWDEARRHGAMKGIPSLFTLVEDAKDIDKMIEELALAVTQACTKVRQSENKSIIVQ